MEERGLRRKNKGVRIEESLLEKDRMEERLRDESIRRCQEQRG